MEKTIHFFIFAFLILISSSSVCSATEQGNEWSLNGRFKVNLESIDINSSAVGNNSREGHFHNEELNLNVTGALGNGKGGIQSRLRTTNDFNIQADGAELLYLRSYYRDKVWTVEAGDVAASLNPYVFGGSLKGVKMLYKSSKKQRTWNYSAIAGFKKQSWRETYTDDDAEAATGYSVAFEATYVHERSKEISVSFAAQDTNLSSAGTLNQAAGTRGYGLGLAGKWRIQQVHYSQRAQRFYSRN